MEYDTGYFHRKNYMKNLMNVKFYEKYAWTIFLIIGIIILAAAIPHTLGFNTDPTLVQTISGQTIDELKTSKPMFFNLYNFYFSGGGLSDLGMAFFIIIIGDLYILFWHLRNIVHTHLTLNNLNYQS
jgi:hypothetical protein